MPYRRNNTSEQVEDKSSKLNPKNSPIPKTTGKIENDMILAKDKSPDDMEILE